MTTLLDRIDSELLTCTDPVRRIDLVAERACYLARSGDIGEATRLVSELRTDTEVGGNPRAMLWVMIIEALVLFYGRLSKSAEDRMNRAFALSSSLAANDLADISGAWLAHFQFERSDYSGMAIRLEQVLSRSTNAPGSAVLRAAIVAADAFQIAGLSLLAQGWYEYGRSLALSLGDRTAVGAIMYNRSALGLAYLGAQSVATGEVVDGDRLRLVQIEIESARSFQDGTRVTALTHLTELSWAQAHLMAGHWTQAAAALESILRNLETIDDRPKRPDVRADLAWCWLNSGQRDKAAALLGQISMQSAQAMDIDDQVTYLARLISLREALGGEPPSAAEREAFRQACENYLQHLAALRAELQRLPAAPALPLSRSCASLPGQHP